MLTGNFWQTFPSETSMCVALIAKNNYIRSMIIWKNSIASKVMNHWMKVVSMRPPQTLQFLYTSPMKDNVTSSRLKWCLILSNTKSPTLILTWSHSPQSMLCRIRLGSWNRLSYRLRRWTTLFTWSLVAALSNKVAKAFFASSCTWCSNFASEDFFPRIVCHQREEKEKRAYCISWIGINIRCKRLSCIRCRRYITSSD